jgi:5-methyltetrahydropteroyltriglutamate--homocysteine methyltransferase
MAATASTRPPFRADHVGSLLRPKELREAFRTYGREPTPSPAFVAVQERAIRDAVKLQEDAGLQVVTDGEFRRSSYWGRFVARCEGFAIKPAVFKFRDDHGHEVDFTATYAAAKLARTQPLATDEFEFLHKVTKVTGKITMPAPSTMHFYRCTDFADASVYADARSFFADLTKIYREEIADLARAGCRYVQLDEVPIAMLCDPDVRRQTEAQGSDPAALLDTYISLLQRIAADRPAGMTFGMHLCRGNFRGRWMAAGGYEPVAEKLFSQAPVDVFFLEYDSERAGDFRPLRFVPKGKTAVVGLVSSKSAALEDQESLSRRIEEASRVLPLDQLALSTQCGFASVAGGNVLTEDQQWAKLELVVDTAARVWGR